VDFVTEWPGSALFRISLLINASGDGSRVFLVVGAGFWAIAWGGYLLWSGVTTHLKRV
jgi:hypothetical protein